MVIHHENILKFIGKKIGSGYSKKKFLMNKIISQKDVEILILNYIDQFLICKQCNKTHICKKFGFSRQRNFCDYCGCWKYHE